MTKKQIRRAGYKAIVKNKKSHQEAFDEISQTQGINRRLLAEELSKIPSNGKQKVTSTLRYLFIAALGLLALLRILGVVVIGMEGTVDMGFLAFMMLIILVVPAVGIYAAIFAKAELYMTTGILLVISLFQAVKRGDMNMEPETLVALIPFVAAIILAFYIPTRLKTPHKRIVTESFVDGKTVKKIVYEFEDTRMNESDIIDSTF